MCQHCLDKYQAAQIATAPDLRTVGAWSLPEGYGIMGPQSPEEFEMTMHQPRHTQTCPHCGWFGRMSMGGCPMCGYDFNSGTIAHSAGFVWTDSKGNEYGGSPTSEVWQPLDDEEWDAHA